MLKGLSNKREEETKAQRIHSLDGLRGIACLAVLLVHTGTMLEPFGPAELGGGGFSV